MKSLIVSFNLILFTLDIIAQTYVPFLLKNGNYVYLDSATKKITSIVSQMNPTPSLFSNKGYAICSENTTAKTRIINKDGEDLFFTELKNWDFSKNDAYYSPSIIYDQSTGEEYILAETYDNRFIAGVSTP